jgi:hypothetical protein
MALDPAAAQTMHLVSEVLASQDVIARQRKIIWGLASALHAEQSASQALCDLLDSVLADERGRG